METKKVIIGILGGIALGTIAGILFAPDKGSNTRKKIIKKSTKAQKDLKGKLDNISNNLSEKYDSLLNKGDQFVRKNKIKA